MQNYIIFQSEKYSTVIHSYHGLYKRKTELLKNRGFKGEQKPFLQNLVTNEVFASKDRAYITSELRLAG